MLREINKSFVIPINEINQNFRLLTLTVEVQPAET